MKKENENAALLSMFDELVVEVKKNRQAILQLQNTIQQYDVGKIVDESIFIALNEKFPNKSQIEKDEEAKRHQLGQPKERRTFMSNTSNLLLSLSTVLKINL